MTVEKGLIQNDTYKGRFSCFSYFITALYMVVVGIVVPFMRDEYGLTYSESGILISSQTLGVMLGCLCAPIFISLIGRKRSNMLFRILLAASLVVVAVCGSYILLAACFLLAGFSRGCITNYHTDITVHIRGDNTKLYHMQQICVGAAMLTMPFVSNYFIYAFGGGSWHAQLLIIAGAFAVLAFFAGRLYFINDRNIRSEGNKNWSFFKRPLFWIITILLFFYQGAEACTMNWLPTYLIDSKVIPGDFSVMLTAFMWVALLIGRLIMLKISKKSSADRLILISLCAVGAVFGYIMVSQATAAGTIIGMLGIGFGLSGVYGTCLSILNSLCAEFPLAISAFLAIANLGGIIFPFVIGVVSDMAGNRTAMYVIPILMTLMLIMALVNLMFFSDRNKVKKEQQKGGYYGTDSK